MTQYLFLIILLLFGFHIFTRWTRKGLLTNKIPGPRTMPILGNLISYDVSDIAAIWRLLIFLTDNWYPIVRYWSFTFALIIVRHPDDMEIMMTTTKAITKGYIYDCLRPWLKNGLLTSAGKKWKQRRKILTPAFHFNIIKKYAVITEEHTTNFINKLRAEGKEMTKVLIPLCSRLTLGIICEAALGVSLDKEDIEEVEKYSAAIHEYGGTVSYRVPRPYLLNCILEWLPFLRISRDMKKSLKTLHEFSEKIIQKRRQYHKDTNYRSLQELTDDVDEAVHGEYMGRKKRLAMLDLLLLAERDGLIDEAGIKEEVDTFTFEGHDTSAMALVFALILLAENKDAQDTARAEVAEIMNKNNGKFGLAQIQECDYLERCVKEALRLYPSVSSIFRRTDDDTEIQLKNGLLPAGSEVLLFIYGTHRDPNFWPEPEKFDPDRFLPERSVGRHPFSYIPFSAGPRNCIGQKFALNELKCIIGHVLYNFHLEPVERIADIEISANIVLQPVKPVHLKFIRIDKN